MEFMAVSVSEKDKLSELAEEALAQTEDKNYQRNLEDRGVRDIVRYGIDLCWNSYLTSGT